MNIGVVNLYGIGNAVMQGGMLKALQELGHNPIAIVDPTRCTKFIYRAMGVQATDYDSNKKKNYHWLVWTHGKTKKLKCGHDNEWVIPPAADKSKKGFMWKFKKHEVEYYMDFARKLGYEGDIPKIKLPKKKFGVPDNAIALGVGYYTGEKFSQGKHWGTGMYIKLCQKLDKLGYLPMLVGDKNDCMNSGMHISNDSNAMNLCGRLSLNNIWALLSNTKYYIGNDTGLGHLIDAYVNKVLFLFVKDGSNPVKNAPWNSKHFLVSPTVDQVIEKFKGIVDAVEVD